MNFAGTFFMKLGFAAAVLGAGAALSYGLVAAGIIAMPSAFSGASVSDAFLIEKKEYGRSAGGKAIEGYEIGNGEHAILLFSAIHGNEKGTADLLHRLLLEIEADHSLLAANKKLVVIPVANPDGYHDRQDKLNANEVNLNLNFQTTDWEQYGPEGTFAGPEPFSEAESKILKNVVQQYAPALMIAFHSQGALVTPENHEPSAALGKWYAQKTGYIYYDDSNFEWDYFGTATRWFAETHGKPAITVELTNHHESDWEINKNALLELIASEALPFEVSDESTPDNET